MPSSHKVILACAGSGKTTYIVETALERKEEKILITTYTNENLEQIKSLIIKKNGCIPSNIKIQTWFSFLLQEGVRPYHNLKAQKKGVRSIYFWRNSAIDKKLKESIKSKPEADDGFYFTKSGFIFCDRASQFAYKCNEVSRGLIIKRLEKIYDVIMIDEAQDLEGWDYDFVGAFFPSSISIILVGDPRQKILQTSHQTKNSGFTTIFDWLKAKNPTGCELTEMNESKRCNQVICDFSDELFPTLPKTTSLNKEITGHDGIFHIPRESVEEYVREHCPIILRYNKNADTLGLKAMNIGQSKGRTYDHVLIFPTNTMLEYLTSKSLEKFKDQYKLYVAVTRAKYSVAFVSN